MKFIKTNVGLLRLIPRWGVLGLILTLTFIMQTAQSHPGLHWDLGGNAITNPTSEFLGTTTSFDLILSTNSVEAMRILSSNGALPGFVAIGTPTPLGQLTIKGMTNQQGAWSFFTAPKTDVSYDGGTDNLFVFQHTNGAAGLGGPLPSTAFMGSNLGINTENPQHQLQVNGSISIYADPNNTNNTFNPNSTPAADVSLFFGQEHLNSPTGLAEWGIQYWENLPNGPGGLNFWKPFGSTGSAAGNGFGNNFLFLADNGNVGIGTAAPNQQLEITRNFRLPPTTPDYSDDWYHHVRCKKIHPQFWLF